MDLRAVLSRARHIHARRRPTTGRFSPPPAAQWGGALWVHQRDRSRSLNLIPHRSGRFIPIRIAIETKTSKSGRATQIDESLAVEIPRQEQHAQRRGEHDQHEAKIS